MNKAIAVAIISTFMVVLSLYAVNAIIVEQQKDRQREISHTLLRYSEDLTQNIASTLKNTSAKGCDNASLNVYRNLKMQSLYFADVGFIENGKITCTAFWGKLANPIALPSELHNTLNGFSLAQFSKKDFFVGNATIYNHLIIFTSRSAYDKFSPVTANYSLRSTTKDFDRTFFTVTSPTENLSRLSSLLFTQTVTQCSTRWDLCVTVTHHNAGLASLSRVVMVLLCLFFLYFIWVSLTLFSLRLYEDRLSLERTLVKAVIANTISVHFQPIIRVADKKIVGVEVLSRWQDNNHKEVSPELFIPLIEKIGLYNVYYQNMIKKSLAEIAGLAAEHQLKISLNVGRTEIEDGKFLAVLRHACLENAIPLSLIKVELSENGVSTSAILEEFCEDLKSAGVKISIDDFGVQNSNLARLSNLKYDEIKVDKSLVDGINEHYKQDILVIFSDALAKLHKTLVFEGVESETQYQFIAQRYPDALVQGWYFSKSLTRHDLASLLAYSAR